MKENIKDVDPVIRRIIHRRNELGLTQAALAYYFDKDQCFISRIENQTHTLTPEEYRIMAKALRVTPSYFFEDNSSESDLDYCLNAMQEIIEKFRP